MKPKISIVVAAYNEEKLLPRFLRSLQGQTYPKEDFEIIIVNNNSTDNTEKVAKAFETKVYNYTDLQGCGPARAYGAKQARGEIVAFSDPDCIVPADWLAKIEKALSASGLVGIGGPALPDKKSLSMDFLFGFYHYFHLLNKACNKPIVWGFNMAFKRDAYNAVEGINPALLSSDDWDLAFRLQKRFGKKSVQYLPDMPVQTSVRKQSDRKVFLRYALNGVINYYNYVILGKVKAIPTFNVR